MFSKFFAARYHCRVLRRVQVLLEAGGLAELRVLQALQMAEDRLICDQRWRLRLGRDLNQAGFESWLARKSDAAGRLRRLRAHPADRVARALADEASGN